MEVLKSILDNNVNVSKTIKNNDNDIGREKIVDYIADKLSRSLNNPGGRLYYCKIAWKLPESVVWSNLEIALAGRDPRKYFTWLCERELSKSYPQA